MRYPHLTLLLSPTPCSTRGYTDGDLTIRNYINDLYNVGHKEESETLLESAADFADNGPNRNLIDTVAVANGWAPYRSVVCFLMYHLQEENLVLL